MTSACRSNVHANGDAADRPAAAGARVRRRRRSVAAAARHRHPLAVRPARPAGQVRRLQDDAVVLHGAHLLLRRHARPATAARSRPYFLSPMRAAIDKGLRPTNHTDFVVAPLDQMFVMWTAVNRISRGGEVIGPDQRVTPLEALKAITIDAAHQYSRGSVQGLAGARQARGPRDSRQESAHGGPDGDQGHPGRRDDQGRKDDLQRALN